MNQSFGNHNYENTNNKPNKWTRSQDQVFERALVIFPDSTTERWEKVATLINGQSPADVREHYQVLLHDVDLIESGQVELPKYPDNLVQESKAKDNDSKERAPSFRSKKGEPWTQEEQRLFLKGLKEYGKGDWKSISRYVVSRTPTQVASHAQKYFQRRSDTQKRRKRTSIHDITLEDNNLVPHPIDQQNGIPPLSAPMHQLQEMRQAQEMHQLNQPNNMYHQRSGCVHQTQELHQLNPPNNMPHQMSGSVQFSNGF